MNFDPGIIETFAHQLYRRASRIVLMYALQYILLGVCSGALVYYFLPAPIAHEFGGVIAGVTPFLFLLIGLSIGNERAFNLRLQAQTALCQLQIERNTRAALAVMSVSARAYPLPSEATHLAPPSSVAVSASGQK